MKKYLIGAGAGIAAIIILLLVVFPEVAALIALSVMCSTGGCS
jgi:predicted small secreted protein